MNRSVMEVNDLSGMIRDRLRQTVGAPLRLEDFLHQASDLNLDDRLKIVQQALLVLRDLYVHRPLKEAQLAVQPVRRLELMRLDLERMRRRAQREERSAAADLPHPVYFHQELTEIFTSVRDRHMRYQLPYPFRGSWATLGFEVEAAHEDGARETREILGRSSNAPALVHQEAIDRDYLVTRVVAENLDGGRFVPGVKVVSWNGAPIENAVQHNGDKTAGSNPAARHARGLHRLTLRPMWTSPPPQQDWVILGYRVPDPDRRDGWSQQIHFARFDWWVVCPPWALRSPYPIVGAVRPRPWRGTLRLEESVDSETAALGRVRYISTRKKAYCNSPQAGGYGAAPPRVTKEPVFLQASPGQHPAWGQAHALTTPAGVFGYLRIFTFEVPVSRFIEEVPELLRRLPGAQGEDRSGLIIDVRDNGGGKIAAGEALLQMLTEKDIEPIRFELLANGASLELCLELERRKVPGQWGPWARSIDRGAQIGALYSSGHPITPPEDLVPLKGLYRGPVVLVVNALSYSTTDILTAGFKDHGIGRILSTDDNIGAGGANTVSHQDLRRLTGDALGLRPLPKGAAIQLALRRAIRVGPAAGTPLEALGIELNGRDRRYFMTRDDILQGNQDLLATAAKLLR